MSSQLRITDFDAFTRAYLHAAAFTEDPHSPQGEYPAPVLEELDPAFVEQARKDCTRFQADHWSDISEDLAHAGRDFWYTRNGHGCGFWDGDWPEPQADRLSKAAHAFGEVYADVFSEPCECEDCIKDRS